MRIAFDAKRIFQNSTGLGHYSRTLVSSLAVDYPQHEYYLMAPKVTGMYTPPSGNVHTIVPQGMDKMWPALWRSNRVRHDVKRLGIELYHGLSHEIPAGIQHTGIRSIATMHDLIFERYPQQYKPVDVAIYRKKFKYACTYADHLIAISKQTKTDLIDLYRVPEDKITVCYQSCSPIFEQQVSANAKAAIREQYKLPQDYLLYVGSIIERKNLLQICKAMHLLKGKINIPLVVIGSGSGSYYNAVKDYINKNGLQQQIVFINEQPIIKDLPGFRSSADLPAIYQMATAMIYPSVFEGFGLPVLEALWSGLPVITSNVSCLPEAGGDAASYINPGSAEELADAIQRVATDTTLRQQMITKGYAHAQKFTIHQTAAAVTQVYEQTVKS